MSSSVRWASWRQALLDKLTSQRPLEIPAVRTKAALVLVDDLAAMVGASSHAEVAAVAAWPGRGTVDGEATVVAGGRAHREHAAAANAVAAGWDELDEGYRPATCHGGLYTVPVALAEVEATGGTLDDLLEAVVVGYEVVTAIARALPAPRPLVLHPHATLSPLGAAATVAWLRTRDPEFVLASVDVASTMSLTGSFRHATQGLQARNAWAGAGALIGFFAVHAAASGLQSDGNAMLDTYRDTYGQAPDEEALAIGFSREHWAILDGYHKLYAACQYAHSALEASAELVSVLRGPVDPASVVEIVVATHPLALALDSTEPTTALGGKFSLPHVVAAVLVRGSTEFATFDAAGLRDPAVAAVRSRVRLRPYEPLPPAPHDRPARVAVRLASGALFEATCLSAVGGPDRPLGAGDVLGKAATLTSTAAPGFGERARALVDGRIPGTAGWAAVLESLVRL